MDPFLLVKLLLLSCNLDEEANQHFLTRSLRKTTACWFLNGAGLVVVGKAAVGGWLSPTLPWASSGQPSPTLFWAQSPPQSFSFLSLQTICLHSRGPGICLSRPCMHLLSRPPLMKLAQDPSPPAGCQHSPFAVPLALASALPPSNPPHSSPREPPAMHICSWGAPALSVLLRMKPSRPGIASKHPRCSTSQPRLPLPPPGHPGKPAACSVGSTLRRPPMPFPRPGEDFFQSLSLSQTFFSLNQHFLLFLDLPGRHPSSWASLSLDTGVSCPSHAPLLPHHGPASPAGHTCLHAHRAPRQSRVLAFLAGPTELLGGTQARSMRAGYTGE